MQKGIAVKYTISRQSAGISFLKEFIDRQNNVVDGMHNYITENNWTFPLVLKLRDDAVARLVEKGRALIPGGDYEVYLVEPDTAVFKEAERLWIRTLQA